jgi:hypothetical protein
MFNRWPKLTATLAILTVVAAVGYLIQQTFQANRRPKGTIWFYNLKTRTLFAASDLSVPPIDTESGPATGVRAYVYATGDGANPGNRFIAFLETLAPETKRDVEADLKRKGTPTGIGFLLEKRAGGILVSSPEVIEWHPKFSQEGAEIMKAGKKKGGSARIRLCLP